MNIKVITAERAIGDGIPAWQIENCAAWHRNAAEREDANGVPALRKRHREIEQRLLVAASEVAAIREGRE